MILEIQAQVRADVLPQRARKVRKAFAEQTIGIRLNEVSLDQAPVVLRPLDIEGERFDVRYHKGVLWRSYEEWPPSRDIEGDMRQAAASFLKDLGIDGSSATSTKRDRKPADGDARIVSSQRDDVTSEVQAWADRNWLVVDGIVHRRIRSQTFPLSVVSKALPSVEMDEASTHSGMTSAWFGRDVGGRLLKDSLPSVGERVDGREILYAGIDIEIVRKDLFELAAAREADNISPMDILRHFTVLARSDLRPHLSLPKPMPNDGRLTLMWCVSKNAWDAAAEDGATFTEASDAARKSIAQMPADHRDAGTILLPAPEDAVRQDIQILYQGHATRSGGPYKGWSDIGTGARLANAGVAVLDPEGLSQIATAGDNRYVVDSDGGFLVSPHGGRLKPKRGRADTWQVEDLAAAAAGFSRRDGTQHDDLDWLGTSLRHRDGRQPLASNTDRPEPMIAVQPDAGKAKVRPWICHSLFYLTSPAIAGKLPPFLFRLDQMDEALDLASCRGPYDDGSIADARIAAPLQLTFDSALWNLHAATKRILDDLDGRILRLDKEAAAAVGRLDKHVETWCLDTSLVASERAVSGFLSDAETLLAAIEHPLMEDIGEDHVREIARTSLERAVEDRHVADIEPVEEFGTFSM